MGKEYTAKVFKSGNSLALRLPKELGLEEGSTMVLREEHGEYRFAAQQTPRARLDVDKFWGKAKDLRIPERRDFDERPSTVARRLAERPE